ncbi:TPA: glutathione peroxidase [Streptococcus suis]|nr:glutathione peroxidase [Streptococcus suis]
MSIYDFTVQKQDGTDQSMAEYQGQVLLIVNTAPGCGLAPQYKELQGEWERTQPFIRRVRQQFFVLSC